MKAYQDKESGKWKWGTRGEPIHETKSAAELWGMNTLTDKLRRLRNKLNGVMSDHGK